jgi:hypothetical protein
MDEQAENQSVCLSPSGREGYAAGDVTGARNRPMNGGKEKGSADTGPKLGGEENGKAARVLFTRPPDGSRISKE